MTTDRQLDALTPTHFLIRAPFAALPERNLLDISENCLTYWNFIQNMVQEFWKRWHQENLISLQKRQKWQQKLRNCKVDDIVKAKIPNTLMLSGHFNGHLA